MSGFIELERARVKWFLSVDNRDVPQAVKPTGKTTFRSISVDGAEVEFSEGFTDLHTRVYELTLAGKGFGIQDARPSIELVHQLRNAPVSGASSDLHPLLRR
jgi:UDP-N-acetyl-2-amino-2-deoxyglucuronate dehydrogenase